MPIAKPKPANLARADVDVIGAREVIVFRRAKKPEAVGQDFQNAFAVHQTILANAAAKNLEDQILFFQPQKILNAFCSCDVVQAMDIHSLQVFDVEFTAFDLLVLGISFRIHVRDIVAGGWRGIGTFGPAVCITIFGAAIFGAAVVGTAVVGAAVISAGVISRFVPRLAS